MQNHTFRFDYNKYRTRKESLELLTPEKAAEYLASDEGKALKQIARYCYSKYYGYLGANYLIDLASVSSLDAIKEFLDEEPYILTQIDTIIRLTYEPFTVMQSLRYKPPMLPGTDFFISLNKTQMNVLKNLKATLIRDFEKIGKLTLEAEIEF